MAIGTISSIKLLGSTPAYLRELAGSSIELGPQESAFANAGVPYPGFRSLMALSPVAKVNSFEIATFFSLFPPPITGLIDTGQTYTGIELYVAAASEAAVRASGSNHKKYVGAKALVVPRQLTAQQGGAAALSFDIHLLSSTTDGKTAPVTITSSVALPTVTAPDEFFTLGPVKVNGSFLARDLVNSVTIDFGISEQTLIGSGGYYPPTTFVSTISPTVTIEIADEAVVGTYGITGAAPTAATIIYFTRMSQTLAGGKVAEATATHISFTLPADQYRIQPSGIGGQNNSVIGSSLMLLPIVGSSAIFTYNGATAIS